jgi:hypothetical protein
MERNIKIDLNDYKDYYIIELWKLLISIYYHHI